MQRGIWKMISHKQPSELGWKKKKKKDFNSWRTDSSQNITFTYLTGKKKLRIKKRKIIQLKKVIKISILKGYGLMMLLSFFLSLRRGWYSIWHKWSYEKSCSQTLASPAVNRTQQSLQCVRNKGPFIIAYVERFFRIIRACDDFWFPVTIILLFPKEWLEGKDQRTGTLISLKKKTYFSIFSLQNGLWIEIIAMIAYHLSIKLKKFLRHLANFKNL